MVSELVVCHEPRHVILKSLDLRTQALMSNLHNPSHRGKQEGHMCHKSFSLRSFCFFSKAAHPSPILCRTDTLPSHNYRNALQLPSCFARGSSCDFN